MTKVFREGKKFFDSEHYMRAEYAVMSKIVYRTKQKFRTSKDFKALEKVYKALYNYFEINISNDLQSFMNLIPARYTEETYLPNKNLLDYILVRLQGIVKLLERIVESCKITAYLFNRRIHTGHFWKIGIIIFSLVSRIYILAKHSAKFICEFYIKLLPFSRQLKNSGRNWLPDGYKLPTDLQKWMDVDWLDIDDELQIIETPELPTIKQFFDLVDDDDIEFCQEYIMVDDDDIELINGLQNLNKINIKQDIQEMRGFGIDEDIGEIIEINDSTILFDEGESSQKEDEINNCNKLSQTDVENNHLQFDEVIELDESKYLSPGKISVQKSDQSNVNEIIILDNSLSSNLKENYSDTHDVTELDDNFQINENNTDDGQVISILDNSLSDSQDVEYLGNSSQEVSNKLIQIRKKTNRLSKEIRALKKINGNSTSTSRTNMNTLIDNDKEAIISISDSSILTEDVNDNLMKKKKFKTKKIRNVIKAFSTPQNNNGFNKNASESHKLSNTIVNLCGKKKKKKTKKNNDTQNVPLNVRDLSQVHTEPPYRPNKKRKREESEVSSSKRINVTNGNSGVFPTRKTNRMKKKLLKKEALIESRQLNTNSKNKKPKKSKKKLKNAGQIAQQRNNLKDIANKIHYNSQDLKRNNKKLGRKKKNRYFN